MGRTCFRLRDNSQVRGADATKTPLTAPVFSSKSTVVFKNAADGRPVELEVKGYWFDRSAEITCGGQAVAHIGRSFFNIRQVFADKQTYLVKCAPNVDLTMIAAICVSLDETENEKSAG
jgi:uncharacterized protein YxjI